MRECPLEIAIKGKEYEQQYQTDTGMYYHTHEKGVSPIMVQYIHLYNDGKMTHLWNDRETHFANFNWKSGMVEAI